MSGDRTLPLAAASLITGKLSPTTPMFAILPKVYAARAMPARRPMASAAILEEWLGTDATSCAMHGRKPRSLGVPQIAAPAPTARGPSDGKAALGERCRAPPSKEMRYSGSKCILCWRVSGGLGPRKRSPAAMAQDALASSSHLRQAGHLSFDHRLLSGRSES